MNELSEIPVSSLSFGTVFKIIFASGMCLWAIMALFFGLLALIAPQSVTINDAPAESTAEALLAVLLILLMGAGMSALGAAIGGGLLKLFAKMLPLGVIRRSS